MPGRHLHKEIRELLKQYDDGLTVRQIADELQHQHIASIYRTLREMPDAYLDRWITGHGFHYTQVWRVVKVPDDCPPPDRPAFQPTSPSAKETIDRVRSLLAAKRLSRLAIARMVGMGKSTVSRIAKGEGVYGRI